jgi:hypothetical protein
MYRMDDRDSISGIGRDYFLRREVQSASRAHLASYPNVTRS